MKLVFYECQHEVMCLRNTGVGEDLCVSLLLVPARTQAVGLRPIRRRPAGQFGFGVCRGKVDLT
jgi:hypothetical protein